MENWKRRALWVVIGALMVLGLGSWWAYENVDAVHFRVLSLWVPIYDRLWPNPEMLPTPIRAANAPTLVLPTLTPLPSSTPFPTALPASTAESTVIAPTATQPPATATPIPETFRLTGFRHEFQDFNNCGPTTLSIFLSYWGWQGTQFDISDLLRPDKDDKNVGPREFQRYLDTQGFDSLTRVNGDVLLMRRLIAAGYPVMIEKGIRCVATDKYCDGWLGHYSLLIGYEAEHSRFIIEDSFRGAGIKLTDEEILSNWRAFNYAYLIVFPKDGGHREKVLALLGSAADETQNYREALARAQAEADASQWLDAGFAWFNAASSLVALGDYANAALAYDQARDIGVPYRLAWYEFGPYQAYYEMGRYEDVIALANSSIVTSHTGGVEEAYYWRGRAEEKLDQRDAAIKDYRAALRGNAGFVTAREALTALGETP